MIAARAGVAATLLTLAVPVCARSQTVDPLFAAVRWAPQPPGSRPAGIGGAFAAVADGGKALYFNPAGLAQIPQQELELSFADPWLSAAARLGPLRLGAYATRSPFGDPEPTADSLDLRFSELGFGVGIAPLHRLKLGVSAAWSGLELAGRRSAPDASGQLAPLVEISGEDRQLRLTFGALFTVYTKEVRGLPSLRVGAAYQRGFDWQGRVAEAAPGAQSRPIRVRRPSVLTAGLAFYGTHQWSLFAQGDVIRYGEVLGSVRGNVGSAVARGFDIDDAIEPRVGGEFAIPLTCGCGTLKLRGGLQYLSPGTLVYTGADPVLEQLFGPRSWRTVASLGASFFAEYFGKALRLDLDSKDVLDGPALSFGIVFRF
jgi:hypothetical protein